MHNYVSLLLINTCMKRIVHTVVIIKDLRVYFCGLSLHLWFMKAKLQYKC